MATRLIRIAYDYALRMFWSPRRFFAIRKLFHGLYTHKPTTFPTPCSFGGMNKLSVYMNCYGFELGGLEGGG